jgi:hypothetical protein
MTIARALVLIHLMNQPRPCGKTTPYRMSLSLSMIQDTARAREVILQFVVH